MEGKLGGFQAVLATSRPLPDAKTSRGRSSFVNTDCHPGDNFRVQYMEITKVMVIIADLPRVRLKDGENERTSRALKF
jgi:hypothetical protein